MKTYGPYYAVWYYRVESDITDMRYFTTLEELSEWFVRQNEIEETIIKKIDPK